MARAHTIEAEGLGKAYRLYRGPLQRALEAASFGRWRRHAAHWALRDVSFRVPRGAALGLCGANGAGKSTLLKVLAGTTAPSAGRYRVRGRAASLLELGTGFHPDFSGRENVLMNGVLMGRARRDVARRLESILAFAELGAAAEAPVRTYSTGMAMRLAFAAAFGLEPEVLILDEVFAVGDMYFQKKCVDRLLEYKRDGRTILLCSHSLYDLRQLCDEALWLDAGRLAASGDALSVTNEYAARQRQAIERATPGATAPAGEWPRLTEVSVVRAADGSEPGAVAPGDSLEVRVAWEDPRRARGPLQVGVALVRQDHTLCAAFGTHLDGVRVAGPRGAVTLALPRLALLSGSFTVVAYLFDEHGLHRWQELAAARELVVHAGTREVGLVRLEHAWDVSVGEGRGAEDAA